MKLKTLIYALSLSLSTSLMANEIKKVVNTDASVVNWLGKKKIVNDKHNGKIKIKEGTVTFDKKGQPLSAEVVLDMTTITNEDLKDQKMKEKLVSHLSGGDFFDVTKFPSSVLSIKKFEKQVAAKKEKDNKDAKDNKAKNAELYKAIGELQIKDQVKPISFDITIENTKGVYKGLGNLTIDRTIWGVKYGSDSFFKGLGDKVIANDINFDFDIVTKN